MTHPRVSQSPVIVILKALYLIMLLMTKFGIMKDFLRNSVPLKKKLELKQKLRLPDKLQQLKMPLLPLL